MSMNDLCHNYNRSSRANGEVMSIETAHMETKGGKRITIAG